MNYKVILPHFEGPFDLILYFIRRDELDIYDIPIFKLTNDFLAYMKQMEELNIELASEFILVAATLMRIKAKMLLPRKEIDEEGQEIDPRQELVQKLLDYKRYKAVVEDLRDLEQDRMERDKRGNVRNEMLQISKEFSFESEMESLSLFKLLKVFQKVMQRLDDRQNRVQHTVISYPYTIRQQKKQLNEFFVSFKGKATFEHVFGPCENRVQALFRFLAMLELVQERIMGIEIGEGHNNFTLYAAAS